MILSVKVFSGTARRLRSAHDGSMGRIGKTYPRFQESEHQGAPAGEDGGLNGLHLFGALVGVIAALGLIGFLITR